MTATWRNFEDYLKQNIIFQSTSNSNAQNKAAEYIILEKAKEKYKLDNYSELIQVLSNFLCSAKETHTNTFQKCYNLPELTYIKEEGKIILKKWDELFPRRTEAKFGRKDNETFGGEISSEVWAILKKIYEDWSKTKLHPTGLEKEADELIMLVLETASKEKYSKIVEKHPDLKSRMKKWLADYEKLTTQQKKNLENDKRMIQKDYDIICSLDDNNSQGQSFWSSAIDFKNWPWKTIGITTIIVVLTLLIVWGIKKMLGIT